MPPEIRSASLGERLAERRRAPVRGPRGRDRAVPGRGCRSPDPPFSVLFLHGPGGIGKSALLDQLAQVAGDCGAQVVRLAVDALAAEDSLLSRTVRHLQALSAGRAGTADEGGPAADRVVLLVDGYERAGAMQGPLREELVAALPEDGIAVLAGRLPPGDGWDDPVWRERLRSVALRGLSPDEASELLHRAGVPEADTARLAERAHGHPLALGLLADLAKRDAGGPGPPRLDADLVTALLHRLVESSRTAATPGAAGVFPGPGHHRDPAARCLGRRRCRGALRLAARPVVHRDRPGGPSAARARP